MERQAVGDVLEALREIEASHDLCIVRLSEPITSSASQQDIHQRTSDASNSALVAPTPASLEADLAHYTELFAKLRFSYVEQVTKEKFIRAIVGDPPLIVSMQENLDMEKGNVEAKAQLKSLKLEVSDMVTELEARGRDLSRRYETVRRERALLQALPGRTEELEERVAQLRAKQDPAESDPALRLPLAKTRELAARRKQEQQELARELEALHSRASRKKKEVERLQAELLPLETRRQNGMAAAREAQRRRDAALGGMADDLEQRARWWRAGEAVLKQALDIQD